MTTVRIGLVAEGITDQIVIQNLVGAYLQAELPALKIEFKNLQPASDGTSGGNAGGWQLVKKWCLNNGPEARRYQFLEGGALFGNDMDALRCDIILVHLDADICHVLAKSSGVEQLNVGAAADEKGNFIRTILDLWLWPLKQDKDKRHCIAPAVESIEAWLVAALSDDIDPESNENIGRRLVEIDFQIKGLPCPEEAKSVQKSRDNYERISLLAANSVLKTWQKCQHFQETVRCLVRAVSNLPSNNSVLNN